MVARCRTVPQCSKGGCIVSNQGIDSFLVVLDQPVTQEEFGQMVGISQQAVSSLCTRGVLLPGQSAQEWLFRYLMHLQHQIIARYMGRGER